ncbi:rhodanese/Cell cycle control phosphatase superfamily protein [Wolffia australiana]
MMPLVCSASPSCSSHFPISFPAGSRKISLLWRSDEKCLLDGKGFIYPQGGIHKHETFFRPHASGYSHSLVMEAPESCPSSTDSSIFSPYPSYFDDNVRTYASEDTDTLPEKWNSYAKAVNVTYSTEADQGSAAVVAEPPLNIENFLDAPQSGDVLLNIDGSSTNNSDILSESTVSGSLSVSGSIPESSSSFSLDDISSIKENVSDLFAGIRDSSNASVSNTQKSIEDAYENLVSSITKTAEKGTDSMDSVISRFMSSFEKSKDQAGDKLTVVSSNLKGNFSEAGGIAVDALRKAVVSFEGFLSNATTFFVFSYELAKSFLPSELQEAVNSAEEKSSLVLTPISFAFGKAYVAIEGVERSIGIDPNDPLVHLILLVAGSATFGYSYWLLLYGGYSGDLSPELTFELLNKEDNVALVDIRPEDLRERDGIPDLRRRARFKYASVGVPEVDGSVKKLLRSGEEVNEALTASIIRNLKIVKNGTKVIILDAGGEQSKSIARSLRKLGVKTTYLVGGGYRSWMKNGLRIKELKPETALDIINEEAEAILEEIKPTPVSIIGYSLGAAASLYALFEWEKTLQLIGVIGLGQSLYRRFSSYQSSEDLKADLGRLLSPLTLGAQALSRVAGNEESKLGLATSPSSTAVQDRVIQAAAKHESQPSDSDDGQTPPVEPAPAAEA